MIPAASVIQVLQLPKTVLLHFRINQIYIKTLTLSKSQCNVPEMHKSNDLVQLQVVVRKESGLNTW